MSPTTSQLSEFIRSLYQTNEFIPLHAPTFGEREKQNVLDTIESTFVSSVGEYVTSFEKQVEAFTGAHRAIATVNGTAALHTALYMSGVEQGDFVITQALTFVATCNAIHHMGAEPVFVDVNRQTLGMCPVALEAYLDESAITDGENCIHKRSGRKICACVPMHTFGHPVQLDELVTVCKKWNIELVEDAAESLGSFYKGQHTGTKARFSALSFNGNKIITTGGGGMLLCANETEARRAKHITTTAKVPHPYEFYHDEPGFNYRMPNLNAALGCAQMEKLETFIEKKRELAQQYRHFFKDSNFQFIDEPSECRSNFWLNAILCENERIRDSVLEEQNRAGIMCRPIWQLMNKLPMFKHCLHGELPISEDIQSRLVNIPSSPIGWDTI
ncbi:LegC family aminotransferase [Idiomarina sp. HP20-50]|uniref:LegC family aminotransferase n=1 Tax=Idiomarina sp. HP20-50 TaxID=3070813 RepID=UPI00294B306B|nr:LegC family aminotransferase [Idiomarina sp. HP20-50]MDV6316962.1 LegC family aminotransferase [Idiomarina sp. HP20-50]